MKRINEILTRLQCKSCDKCWCVFDAPTEKKSWFCPWCGLGQIEEPDNLQDVPEYDHVQELKITLNEATKELEKLFGEFGNIFKKK